MKKEIKHKIRRVADLIFIVFLLYIIFELSRKILGGSLGFEELVITLLSINIGHSFYNNKSINKLNAKLSKHLGWHRGIASNAHRTLNNIASPKE